MRYHIDRMHKDVDIGMEKEEASSPKIFKFATSKRPLSKDRAQRITELIAQFIATDMRPVNMIEVR